MAATGIGAGDLATASFAGSFLGTAVLWAVAVGAFMKFVVTEGIARWQLATGQTWLEGVVDRLGPAFGWLFLAYLLFWSFFVGSALISACGVALHALFPVFDEARTGKIVFGALCSLAGWAMVLAGGYSLFEKIMKVCIGFMFLTVISTAAVLWPGTESVLAGLFVPTVPQAEGALTWTVALIGGVGGTVTVLCYGYWIREEARDGPDEVSNSRIDLAAAYLVTAVFGIAMVIIGSTIEIEGRGASLLVDLSAQLGDSLGAAGKWAFLIGATGAVFSSLLGVWQAVPYLFADLWRLLMGHGAGEAETSVVDTRAKPYRAYLAAIALLPLLGLFQDFREMQKLYALVGAWFLPALTLTLLILNGRGRKGNGSMANKPLTTAVLVLILVFFSGVAISSF